MPDSVHETKWFHRGGQRRAPKATEDDRFPMANYPKDIRVFKASSTTVPDRANGMNSISEFSWFAVFLGPSKVERTRVNLNFTKRIE